MGRHFLIKETKKKKCDLCKPCLRIWLNYQKTLGVSRKAMIAYTIFSVILLLSFIFMIVAFYDPCSGRVIKKSLCQLYEEGVVSGKLCYPLCKENVPIFSHCIKQQSHVKEFFWERHLIVKVNMAPDQANMLDTILLEPWEGISQEEFSMMIDKHLTEKLGPADHTAVLKRILTFGDFNNNGVLTYGEARSLWSLIQHREFLLMLLFKDNDAFPRINGTCGSVYAIEHVPNDRLYNVKSNSWLSLFLSDAYHWQFPAWKQRAKMSIGMIELIMDIFEKNDVNFYMCNIFPKSFGYTVTYDLKLMDVLSVVPRFHLKLEMANRSCNDDRDYSFSLFIVTAFPVAFFNDLPVESKFSISAEF
ncbi:unnamed protein product [Acanthosepion pharaonis]|uniref:FAM69 N-terminal domain-containing protein n=1 Tax=Acanthosepion pharaonis TaxID=158019 RepID=A0A812EZ53_ACAPH|nr:unnamed protein product [Sepia pharaonis]